MKLDVANPQAVRIEFGRIDWYPENRESDHEFVVIDTWFSVVSHADAVVDQRKGRVVGLGCATNFTCLKVTKGREIPGDACPVDAKGRGRRGRGQSAAMVDVLKVPPQITILASARHTEISVGTIVADDEAAPGHEVAWIRQGRGTDRTTWESSCQGQYRYEYEQDGDRSTHC